VTDNERAHLYGALALVCAFSAGACFERDSWFWWLFNTAGMIGWLVIRRREERPDPAKKILKLNHEEAERFEDFLRDQGWD
jgi:hypothetical protein